MMHPALFLSSTATLCPIVLRCLASSRRFLRLRAALALAGFTHAAIQSHTEYASGEGSELLAQARRRLQESVQSFSKTQCVRSKPPAENTLRDLVFAAMPTSVHEACGPDVPWAFSVIACLTVLAEEYIFTSPALLKMVVQSLQTTGNHVSRSLRMLHSFTWKCLVWSFARMPALQRDSLAPRPSTGGGRDIRTRAFAVVRQDGRYGVRSALVYALLSSRTGLAHVGSSTDLNYDAVADAISVVYDLVTGRSKTLYKEGTALLRQLTSAIGISTSSSAAAKYSPHNILAIPLLDGRLVGVEDHKLHDFVKGVELLQPTDIPPLSEAEVDNHWDSLFTAWETAVKRAVEDGEELTLRVRIFISRISLIADVPEYSCRVIFSRRGRRCSLRRPS
jgi:hypothetical protein